MRAIRCNSREDFLGQKPLKTTIRCFTSVLLVAIAILGACEENADEKLIQAVKSGYTNEVIDTIAQGANVNVQFKVTLQYGREYQFTPLLYAARLCASPDLVHELLQSGADISAVDNYGRTALMYAAMYCEFHLVEKLVRSGADIAARDNEGETPLHYLSRNRSDDVEILELFIQAGADPGARDFDGHTPFWIAAIFVRENLIFTYLSMRIGVSESYEEQKTSLMMVAEYMSDVAILERMIQLGADPSARDNNGKTVLMHAAQNNNSEMASALIEKGINVDEVDSDGYSALMIALMNGGEETAQVILENTTDINAVTTNKYFEYTPLILALANGASRSIIDDLLQRGAQVNKHPWNASPLTVALSNRADIGIIQALLERGADPNIRVLIGATAIKLALTYEDSLVEALLELLLEHGAIPTDSDISAAKKHNLVASSQVLWKMNDIKFEAKSR